MASKIKSLFGSGESSYPAPPPGHESSFSKVKPGDGTDLFRLMSKANKYSGSKSNRKQRKADEYAYMAGAMLHQNGVTDSKYQPYLRAYAEGGQHGLTDNLLSDFRTGARKQNRVNRRTERGRYEGKMSHVPGTRRQAADGSMFDYHDTDTSSSSDSDSEAHARQRQTHPVMY